MRFFGVTHTIPDAFGVIVETPYGNVLFTGDIKIENKDERAEFIKWLYDLEYRILGIPQPDLVILLDLDPDIARALKAVQRKEQGQSLDAHESDSQILDKARQAYLEAANLSNFWVVIDVATKTRSKDLLAGLHSREVIHNKIWAKVKPFLGQV